MPANLTTKLGQLVDVLTPDTTNTRIGVANASPTRTLDVTGTFGASGASTLGGALTYGGITLSNAVTGTGSMVLSISPTLTGTAAGQTNNAASETYWQVLNNSASNGAFAILRGSNGTSNVDFGMTGTGYAGVGSYTANQAYIRCDAANGVGIYAPTGPIKFNANGWSEVGRFDTSGNWLLGSTSVGTASTYTNGAVALAPRFITHQSGQSAAASATWIVLSFGSGSYGATLNGLLSVNLTYSGVVNTFIYAVCAHAGAGGSAVLLNASYYGAGPYVTVAVYDPGGGGIAVRLTNTSSETVTWGYSWLNLGGNVATYG